MGEKSSVKVHGMWASPYVLRPLLALKIKGIQYEYIEEDLQNKSELLIKYNPVHKKVPVLVHNGQPITESLVILEYIDETWTDPPHLLPKDPYLRAKHRFWAAYWQPVFDMMLIILKTEGEAQMKVVKELQEKLDIAEEGLREIYPNGAPSFQDGNPGYLDIVFCSFFGAHIAMDEFFGTTLLSSERYPLLASWIMALTQVPAVKELSHPTPKVAALLKSIRQKALQRAAA